MTALRSAEPRAPEDDGITSKAAEGKPAEPPEWVTKLAEQRQAFQEKLAERQNVMVPDEDWGYLGQAWPWQEHGPAPSCNRQSLSYGPAPESST